MQDRINRKECVSGQEEDKENKIETANKKETIKSKEISRRLEESQTAYLQRAGDLVTQKIKKEEGILFDVSRAREEDLAKEVVEEIEEIVTQAAREQKSIIDLTENNKAIKGIESSIGYHHRGDLTDSDSFDTTERGRKFFETQKGKGASKRETYWNTLFFPYNTEATRTLAKQMLDDKKIVLLGGGRSRLAGELQENGIVPASIVNIDPFVESVEVEADPVIPLNATAENFIERMSEQGIETADEVWAEYSVPAYLEDPKEIQQLIQNIDELLAEGGSARIWPIQVGGGGDDADLLTRKNALMESLEKINQTNKYEIVLYKAAGRHGFILHKVKSQEKETQESDDWKKIGEIEKVINSL